MSGKIASSRRLAAVFLAATLSLIASVAHAAGATISGDPRKWIPAGKYYYFQPTVSNAGTASVRFEIRNKPAWITFDAGTGSMRGYTAASHVGRYSDVVVSAIVGGSRIALPEFDITVTEPNTAPTITGTPSKSAPVGTRYAFQPVAKDANGDRLSFTVQGKPAWLSFDQATGLLQGTPQLANVGTTSSILISVSDGKVSTALPSFTVAVLKPNTAPTIAGTPPSTIRVGETFNFRPTASDADGDKLTFGVQNLPAWADFDAATGAVSGVADAVGSYSGITVSVSDGTSSRALAPFTLSVTPVVARSASLSWARPTKTVDGASLSNLAGYRVHYGTHSGSLDQVIELPGADNTNVSIEDLSAGNYYFAIRAYTADDVESDLSEVVSKTIL
jgi:hypothetical protein